MANEKMLCGLGEGKKKTLLGFRFVLESGCWGPLIYTLQHVSLWSLNDFDMAAENNHQKLGALFSNSI